MKKQTTKISGLSQIVMIVLLVGMLIAIVAITFLSQELVEKNAFSPVTNESNLMEQREIDKISAEIRQIRSDTAGSLFWLKMVALFVTVGGAVGGYLVGQSRTTRQRITFENRKEVDSIYQSIVKELSDSSALLRAAAAVKLGKIMQSFPEEWDPDKDTHRRDRLIELTKRVLAAALSIEENPTVLKTLTIAIVQHHPWEDNPELSDLHGVNLSYAKAVDAYWARVEFSYTDFYRANLIGASFKEAVLHGAQFREAKLNRTVLVSADCENANFKLADLRGADFTKAKLKRANFEEAKVYGVILSDSELGDNPNMQVDISSEADGSKMISVREWLAKQGQIQ